MIYKCHIYKILLKINIKELKNKNKKHFKSRMKIILQLFNDIIVEENLDNKL